MGGGGKVIFPDFSRRKMLFPGKKMPILVDPKTNFRRFQKWKAKKKKKKKGLTSNFPPSLAFPCTILFPFFSSQFSPIFPFFLIRQQKFPGQKSLGGTLPPPCPPPVTSLHKVSFRELMNTKRSGNQFNKDHNIRCISSFLFEQDSSRYSSKRHVKFLFTTLSKFTTQQLKHT